MSQVYFQNFPLIRYNGHIARNIVKRATIVQKVITDISLFYTHTLEDNERPEDIALALYKNVDYVWLVWYSNQIIDPYFDWPLSQTEFGQYITEKYGSIQQAQTTIVHYKYDYNNYVNIDNDAMYKQNYKMPVPTYNLAPNAAFIPVTAYSYEMDRNESRREIKLLDPRYLSQIEQEFTRIF